jgi:phosphoadenosine phosphosulfate reductase
MMNSVVRTETFPVIHPDTPPEDIYLKGREHTSGQLTLACSFSIDDIVLIDLLKEYLGDLTIFAIDTGRLNEETYEVADILTKRYGLQINWYFPRSEEVERLERDKGLFSFQESIENRKECCHIRKVEPLQRALKGSAGWITGMRRMHGVTRADLAPLEIDRGNGGLLKINPLTSWSDEQIWAHTEQQGLPLNALYKHGYTSIGCAPCTRATETGESTRAGRWWWEEAEHRECGLHRR